jgi:Flp pilus assembly pilin Flp
MSLRPFLDFETLGEWQMEVVQRLVVRAREALLGNRNAQTMTEYVLIVAAIAIVVYGTYQALGNNITSFVSGADSVLTNA